MKYNLLFTFLLIFTFAFSQQKVEGYIGDFQTGEPVIGVDVIVDSTSLTKTDEEGLFEVNLAEGTYNFQFVKPGFIETSQEVVVNPDVFVDVAFKFDPNYVVSVQEVETAKQDSISSVIAQVAAAEEAAKIAAQDKGRSVLKAGKRDKGGEAAALNEQKKAEEIKEVVGAKQLSKQGVSDVSGAVEKVAGITKSENSGDVFVRGLGDRYIFTTLNGLPIPSDDIERKNISLDLFSTDILSSVEISKTFSPQFYGDYGATNINVVSKEYDKKHAKIGLSTGANTNTFKDGIFLNFKRTDNSSFERLGVTPLAANLKRFATTKTWQPQDNGLPLDFNVSFDFATKIDLFNKPLGIVGSFSHGNTYTYRDGVINDYSNVQLLTSFTDRKQYDFKTTSNAFVGLNYKLNRKNKIKLTSLIVNSTSDQYLEYGRNGEGFVLDQINTNAANPFEGAFVQDLRTRQNLLMVEQLHGFHKISEKLKLDWGLGANYLLSREPNRIRIEGNYTDASLSQVSLATGTDFQNRRNTQRITDFDYNGFYNFKFDITDNIDLKVGQNARLKSRAFSNRMVGIADSSPTLTYSNIDSIDELLNETNFDNGDVILREQGFTTRYEGDLNVHGFYGNIGIKSIPRVSLNLGLRYEIDNIDVEWQNVPNFSLPQRSAKKEYDNFLPSITAKYEVNRKSFIRFAASKTINLPEFKEIAPFEYISPDGRLVIGNQDLEASDTYSADLKWEFYPSSTEVFSVGAFGKIIEEPISKVREIGARSAFTFENAANEARVAGIEVTARVNALKRRNAKIDVSVNATAMHTEQDLKETFAYGPDETEELQGAPNFILNGSVTYSNTNKDRPFLATLTANYSSDKIFSLGNPEALGGGAGETFFSDAIIEKGFVKLDLVVNKQIADKWNLKAKAKNILNPKIEQTQDIFNNQGIFEQEVVSRSYRDGIRMSLGVDYTF